MKVAALGCGKAKGFYDIYSHRTAEMEVKAAENIERGILFLTENRDNLLIENFVPIYASRLGEFPSSTIHFDKCGIAEENIDRLANAFCDIKKNL